MDTNQTAALKKTLLMVLSPQEEHWVGNGFFVSSILSPFAVDPELSSPFLLLDHAAPKDFKGDGQRRGVGEHPHRGFETVTFAYAGEVAHRDSHGGGGTIGPGDVQWMTAASGVVHEEMHSPSFGKQGGSFEMVQLWVNLPARLKMSQPSYQALLDKDFPRLKLGDAEARLISGELEGHTGPARTNTPIRVFDLVFKQSGTSTYTPEPGHTSLLFVRKGRVTLHDGRMAGPRDLMIFDPTSHGSITLEAEAGSELLVLEGQPLGEPVVAHGPFVMNSADEIRQAIYDYQSGKMGHLGA